LADRKKGLRNEEVIRLAREVLAENKDEAKQAGVTTH
jgi:hypothetical protein